MRGNATAKTHARWLGGVVLACALAASMAGSAVAGDRDTVPPTLVPTITTDNDGNRTVSFSCSDDGSGVVTCPAPQQVGPLYQGTVVATAADNAGNRRMIGVNIAKYVPRPPADANFPSDPPPVAQEGAEYSYTFTAADAPDARKRDGFHVVTAGNQIVAQETLLPPGLSLSHGGVLSGKPTKAGSYTFSIRVHSGTANTTDDMLWQAFTIEVRPLGPLAFVSDAPPEGSVGVAYSHQLTALGLVKPKYQVMSGTLPGGLTLSEAGVLSGTPTAVGSTTVVVGAADAFGASVLTTYTMVVR